MNIGDVTIEIYADISSIDQIKEQRDSHFIRGFTSNPTLIKQSGAKDYLDFARKAAVAADPLRLSLEVVSDDLDEMYLEAVELSKIGNNVDVKIPVTNTRSESTMRIVKKLLAEKISVNVTAVFTEAQILEIKNILAIDDKIIISVFAGRIADTGVDPVPLIKQYRDHFAGMQNVKILWASPREVLNIIHAQYADCDIITATPDLLNKTKFFGKNLLEFSLDTVKMFYNDAQTSGFTILEKRK